MGDIEAMKQAKSTLVNRNIVIDGRRTSVRLEAEMWNDLYDVARREEKTVNDICSMVNQRKAESRSLTSAIRVFLIVYYRSAATEEGHYRAGHGEGFRIGRPQGDRPQEGGPQINSSDDDRNVRDKADASGEGHHRTAPRGQLR